MTVSTYTPTNSEKPKLQTRSPKGIENKISIAAAINNTHTLFFTQRNTKETSLLKF